MSPKIIKLSIQGLILMNRKYLSTYSDTNKLLKFLCRESREVKIILEKYVLIDKF